jgi:hypothetical protein
MELDGVLHSADPRAASRDAIEEAFAAGAAADGAEWRGEPEA